MDKSQSIKEIAAPLVDAEGGLLPALNAVQARFGFLPAETASVLAEAFNISVADVAGVIGFYTDYQTAPQPSVVVEVCRAEACQAAGGRALAAAAEAALGCGFDEADEDTSPALVSAYCFGKCALAPAARVNGRLIGRIDGEALAAAIVTAGDAS